MPLDPLRSFRWPRYSAAACALVFFVLPASRAESQPLARTGRGPGAGFTLESRTPGVRARDLLAQADPDSLPGDSLATPAEPPADSLATPATPRADTLATPVTPPPPPDRDHAKIDRESLSLRGHGRPNIFQSVIDGAKNFVSDALYIYTAPIRMDAKNVAYVAGVGAVGAGLYGYDDDLFRGVVRSREDPVYQAVVLDAGGFFEPAGLISRTHWWLQGASVAGYLLDVPLLRTIPGEILESNSIIGPLRQPIEHAVHRQRPSRGGGARDFSGGSSFPSGHASVICETAAILSHHARYPLARIAIWSAAGLVCAQRMNPDMVLNHWPSDVWIGAALGTWGGHTIAKRNEERRHGIPQRKWYDVVHRPPKADWSVMPYVTPDGGPGMAVRSTF